MFSFNGMDYSCSFLHSRLWKSPDFKTLLNEVEFKKRMRVFNKRLDQILETFKSQCPCEHRELLKDFIKWNMNWIDMHWKDVKFNDPEGQDYKTTCWNYATIKKKAIALGEVVNITDLKTAQEIGFDQRMLMKNAVPIPPSNDESMFSMVIGPNKTDYLMRDWID
jgi:hypothetical protein